MNHFIFVFVVLLSMLLGGVLASGLFCFAERKRAGIPWTHGRSRCDSCGATLGVLDLIPVLSYLFLKGKCRICHGDIPASGFRVEFSWSLIAGVLSAVWLGWYGDTAVCVTTSVVAVIVAVGVFFWGLKEGAQRSAKG